MGYYRAGKWLKSDFEYEKREKKEKKLMWFFSRRDSEDTVKDRAKRNKISNDEQLWRDAGALSSKEVEKLNQNKINFFKKNN